MNPIYDSVCRDLGYRPVETRISFGLDDEKDRIIYRLQEYYKMFLLPPDSFNVIKNITL